jgi:peptidoglycan/LPS O-acetylase OafA/YrhL
MPAFWVCLLLTAFVAAPLAATATGRAAGSVFTADTDPADGYVINNIALMMRQFGIAGLPDGATTEPGVWNGSLWTLFYEACCYAVLAGLGAVGVLGRRRWALLVALAGTWAVVTAQAGGLAVVPTEILPGFALMSLPVRHEPAWDLSYGVYIYHWPIQQVAPMSGADSLAPVAFVGVTLLLVAAAAALSWVSTERPALAWKNAAW